MTPQTEQLKQEPVATETVRKSSEGNPGESVLKLELAEEDRTALRVLLGGKAGEHPDTVGSRLSTVVRQSVAGVDISPDGSVLIRLVRGGIARAAEMLEANGAIETEEELAAA